MYVDAKQDKIFWSHRIKAD